MANIKKFSTGEIGNEHPVRDTSNNPNTKGLTTEERPGIEAYIEEDPVDAYVDNRPLRNLVSNDILLDQNSSDVASEVDSGVFKDRYNEFDVEVLPTDLYADPEKPENSIYVTPLRIKSGSSIINGQVTRIGNQKIIYFIKEKNNQIIFPQYSNVTETSLFIDDPGYDGDYSPVYDSVADGLPENFENYEIQIRNVYSDGRAERIQYFKTFRDWEDIVPYKPHTEKTVKEIVNFGTDINYGQDSEGYWLRSGGSKATLQSVSDLPALSSNPSHGDVYYVLDTAKYYKFDEGSLEWKITTDSEDYEGVKGTVTSSVKLEKNISVKDKFLHAANFTVNQDGTASHSVVTDGIFFEDIKWTETIKIDSSADILDMYVDENDNLYFITAGLCKVENPTTGLLEPKRFLFRLTRSAIELENKITGAEVSDTITYTRMRKVGNYLFLMGTDGFITTWDLTKNFNSDVVSPIKYFEGFSGEAFKDAFLWNDQLFVASDTKIYHTGFADFDPLSSSFEEIDLQLSVVSKTEKWKGFVSTFVNLPTVKAENDIYYVIDEKKAYIWKTTWLEYTIEPIVKSINKFDRVIGNTIISSALEENVINLLDNSSFENGTSSLTSWNLISESGGSTVSKIANSTSDPITGNFKAYLTKNSLDIKASLYQDKELSLNLGDKYTFSVYLAPTESKIFASTIRVEEYSSTNALLGASTQAYSVSGLDSAWQRVSLTHTVVSTNATKLRVIIDSETTSSALQIDNAQLEIGDSTNEYVENFDYLFVGFEKVDSNKIDSPFALIDSKEEYVIQYTPGVYGNIHSINETKFVKNNLMYAVSNDRILSINFLNNEREYDRVSVSEINNSNNSFDFTNKIERFETIELFNDRILVGGIVSNKVVRFRSKDLSAHKIKLYSKPSQTKQSLMTLMGSTTEITQTSTSPYSIEFNRVENLLESRDGSTSLGRYLPGATYTLTIEIDDDIEEDSIDIDIEMPDRYNEPVSMELIADRLKTKFDSIIARKPSIVIETSSSSTVVEGFMSFSKLDLVRHIRGDIHKIVLKDGENEYFYLVRNKQIFKTKYDPNVLKTGDTYADYNWDLVSDQHEVKQYKKISNKEITINDNAYNTGYINLGVTSGYTLLKGSVKIKTNEFTQSGFSENIDYEIDYNSARIIRKFSDNLTQNNTFEYGSNGSLPNNWKRWGNRSGGIGTDGVAFNKTLDKTGFTEYCAQQYIVPVSNPSHPKYNALKLDDEDYLTNNADNLMSAYQVHIPSNMNIGDTYTFSVYLNSYNNTSAYISLSESQSYSTSGYQIWKYDSPKTLSSPSGLESSNKIYNATITIDGSPTLISFQGNQAPTIQNVLNLLNTQLATKGAFVEWIATGNGAFKVNSVSKGLNSTITISATQDPLDSYLFHPVSGLTDLAASAEIPVNGDIPRVERDELSLVTGEYHSQNYIFDSSNVGKWVRFEVTHTITDDSSDCLRFEIRSVSQDPIYVAKPMLERNTRATPYTSTLTRSRIDPDSKVYVDFIEFKSLKKGTSFTDGSVEYIFDSAQRKVTLKTLDLDSDYHLNYKYIRIFNGHIYGDRLPIYRVIYDSRDDFFMYEYEGRIWAINQMLSMLSFDIEDPMYVTYEYHFPRIDIVKIRNSPDKYGNYVYLVKGKEEKTNPYRPFDRGAYNTRYTIYADAKDVVNTIDNEILYELNVTNNDYSKNELYDRRIYIDAKDNTLYNISLTPETVAYMPFSQDFNATNGMMPLYPPSLSKIVSIIKNFKISQREEIGAWHDGYDSTLRKLFAFPGSSFCIFVSLDYGDDNNDGKSEAGAVRTIKRALELTYYENQNNRRNNIVITTSGGVINEDVLVNTSKKIIGNVTVTQPSYEVFILARTYSVWRGALQNETPVTLQGIYFENSGIYPFSNLNINYCTLDDTNINCSFPQVVSIKNTEIKNNHNSVIRVTDVLFPSPFVHPYQRNLMRSDDVAGSPESVATRDNESIAPGDSWYNANLATQPQGQFAFFRCLIHGSTDTIVHYDPSDEINSWISSFDFEHCTITRNYGLFTTNKFNLSINYSESIIVDNGEQRGENKKEFNSNSNISIINSFIDFDKDGESIFINYGQGVISNRTTCKGGVGSDPQFLTINDNILDFHLKSIARGSSIDSPCLDASSQSRDLGCYDELRLRTEVNIPKKLRTKVAHLKEGIRYPIVLNSEKITFTIEFKPVGTAFDDLVLLDTRTSPLDEDYLIVCYNNNAYNDEDYIIERNPANSLDMPNRFRVVVANKEKIYSVVSPIEIYSDEQYQQWHRLTFSINYELVYKTKTNFTDENRQQNIITLYHNDKLAIESFIKYDLQRSIDGPALEGDFQGTNAWNYNNVSSVITLGSDYNNQKSLECFCSEIRIDNRFIDRKELRQWLVKEYPFNDPYTRVNEATLAKTLEPATLNEYWSLKTKFDKGAKFNKFSAGTSSRFTYIDKQFAWVLTKPTNNLFIQSDFAGMHNAEILSREAVEWSELLAPIVLDSDWILSSEGTRTAIDSEIILEVSGKTLYNREDLKKVLEEAFAPHTSSNVKYIITTDNRIKFYTKDYGVTKLSLNMGLDYDKLKFDIPQAPLEVLEGIPIHGGKEYSISTGVPVIINPTDNAFTVAEKTALALNSLVGDKFEAEVIMTGSPAVATNRISITNKVKGDSRDIRQGDILRIEVSTTIPGSIDNYERSEIYFLSGIENDASGVSRANSDYYGRYFEIYTPDDSKYYVWYRKADGITPVVADPVPDASGWFVTGIEPGSIDVNGNNVWIEENPEYTSLNTRSMAAVRLNREEDDLLIYQNIELTMKLDDEGTIITPTTYHFSAHVYFDGYLKNDQVLFMLGTDELNASYSNFDRIERNIGNWWILSKKIEISSPRKYVIGIKIDSNQVLYINAMQLEQNDFVTPYVSNASADHNQLIVSKSLMGEEKGTIFFRWKPLFSYSTTEERVLLQVLGRKYTEENGIEVDPLEIVDQDKGFSIKYSYDTRKKVGHLIYSVNDVSETNNSTWRIKVPEISWNNWHSSAIIYDYNTDKFVFAFDHFKEVMDLQLVRYPMWTNLYIGRDATSGVDPDISQIVDIIVPGDTSKSLESKHWTIHTKDSKYYVWYNVDGVSADPLLSNEGYVSVPVIINQDDSSVTVAQKTLMALGNYPLTSITKDFLITRRNNILRIKNKEAGLCIEPNTGTSGVIVSVVTPSSNSVGIKSHAYGSAEIAVKDIIFTANAISESEELKWHNTYEFFNEYLIINTLNSYQKELNDLIMNVNEIASSPLDMSRRIDEVEGQMNGLQVSQGNLESDVNLLTNLVQSSQAVALEQIKSDLIGLTTIVNTHSSEMEFMQDGNTGQWTTALSSSSGGKYSIFEVRKDVNTFRINLDAEIAARISGDSAIRDDLGSTSLSKGAALVAIHDENSVFPNLGYNERNVESALQNLAGFDPGNPSAHRTNETVYGNAIAINSINTTLNSTNLDMAYLKDGSTTGGNWSRNLASTQRYNVKDLRLDANEAFDRIALIKDGKLTSAQAYQNVRFNSILTPISDTGLQAAQYTVSVIVDTIQQDITISGSESTTWEFLLDRLNTQIVGASFTISGSDAICKFISNTYGASSSVEIVGGNLFSASSLKAPGPQFIAIDPKVSGRDDSWSSTTMNLYTLREDIDQETANRILYEQNVLSTAVGKGASLVGVVDSAEMFTSTNVEAALAELAGTGRTNQSIKSNYDLIVTANTNIASNLSEINKTKDGTLGTTWTTGMNLKSHDDSIITINSNVASNLSEINKMKDGTTGTTWGSSMNLKSFDDRLDLHDSNITNLTQGLQDTDLNLGNEVSARQVADQAIRNDLASGSVGKGASLIAVRDDLNYFINNNVEKVLEELHDQIVTLEGAISWQPPVATYADLPITGNALSDSRTVTDDGDGHPAQYLCVKITGTRAEQWTKIADIDWNNAKDIAFAPVVGVSTNVQDIIEEMWKRTSDISFATTPVVETEWSAPDVNGLYTLVYTHNLGTSDVVLNITDSANNVIGVEEITRLDEDRVELKSSTPFDGKIYCFASINNYSTTVNSFENSGTRFKKTINHNLGSRNILVSVFDTTTGLRTSPGDIKILDEQNIEIYVESDSVSLNVYVLKNIESTISKDLNAWTFNAGWYNCQIESNGSYDSIYQFFDPISMKTVDVEDVRVANGKVIITKSDNSLVRMIQMK